MDNNTDEREPTVPPEDSSDNLEEALKWLEALTSRQPKPPGQADSGMFASLNSPFEGLIEGDDDDLPDWLREVPSLSQLEDLGDVEMESRLDWLAKMAQRESIEELPTLEWRRLPPSVQNELLSDLSNTLKDPSQDDLAGVRDEADADGGAVVDLTEEITAEPDTEGTETDFPIVEGIPEVAPEQSDEIGPEETFEHPVDQTTPAPTPNTEDGSNLLTDDGPIPAEERPPVDDLDAAMAWIEELAASQDAPVEDVPSVADRALASKLMTEAGLSADSTPLDELGSDSSLLDGRTPTHPFIEEEDFADTVVLVETLAADQTASPLQQAGEDLSPSDGPDVADRSSEVSFEKSGAGHDTAVPGEITPYEPAQDPLSFDDAMAFLDRMAIQSETEISGVDDTEPGSSVAVDGISIEGEEEVIVFENVAAEDIFEEETDSEVLLSEDAPWNEEEKEPVAIETIAPEVGDPDETMRTDDVTFPELSEESIEPVAEFHALDDADASEQNPVLSSEEPEPEPLEALLQTLDSLALPVGTSLGDIDRTLRSSSSPLQRDLFTSVDWLETALAGAGTTIDTIAETSPTIDEAELISQMPDDPDAILAWLEQMAEQETGSVMVETSIEADAVDGAGSIPSGETGPLIDDLIEADLLAMPDDPDEAMAWLEGLSRGGAPTASRPDAVATTEEALTGMGDQPSHETGSDVLEAIEVTSEAVMFESTGPLEPEPLEYTDSIEMEEPETITPAEEMEPPNVAEEIQTMPESPVGETGSVVKPAKQRSAASWVDLLKPLED